MIEDAGIVGEDDDVVRSGRNRAICAVVVPESRMIASPGWIIEAASRPILSFSDVCRPRLASTGGSSANSNHPRRDGSAIAAHQHSALLEEREVLPDGLGRDAELLGEREHLGAAFGIQHPDDFLTSPAGVPHCSSLTQI